MARTTAKTNNVMAGLFLLTALLGAVAASFILADAGSWLGGQRSYQVRFELGDGVPGLEPVAMVKIGGMAVGSVASVNYAWTETDGRSVPEAIIARVRLDQRVNLYDDAVASLEVPLLGSGSTLNFASIGGGTPGARWIEPGGEVRGRVAPPSVLGQAGFGDEQRDTVQQIIADAGETTARVRQWAQDIDPRVDPIVTRVEGAVDDFAAFAAWLETGQVAWGTQVDQILSDVRNASATLEPAIVDLRNNSQQAIADSRAFLASLQTSVDENRPSIMRSVENVEAVTERARVDTMDELSRLLDSANAGVAQFATLGERSNLLVTQQTPTVQRTLANFRLISDQAKLAVAEVRSQPWRLLFQPKTRELEQQLLLDAARAYALASSDLRDASVALDELLAALPDAQRIDPAELIRMRGTLDDAFGRFQATERELIQQFTNPN